MDFFDNVVNKSNALIKERLNNPFGGRLGQTSKDGGASTDQPGTPPVVADGSSYNNSNPQQTETSPAAIGQQQQQTTSTDPPQQDTATLDPNGDKNNSQFAAIAADAEAVAQKAAQGAKSFGTFLFSMANKAGQHVQQTAKQVKQAVESTNILTDFTREQQDFIKEHGGSIAPGQLPWDVSGGEGNDDPNVVQAKSAEIREQILSLSQDKRNFVRGPPNDANFQFDPEQCYPIALSLLREDPNLNKIRFELVPKLVNEDTFWRNYFYRVTLLKQMSEKGESVRKGWSSSRSSSGEGPDEVDNDQEPLSPNYNSSNSAAANTAEVQRQQSVEQRQQQQYSSNPNTDSTTTKKASDFAGDYSQELESSESRKLMADADDLKSKLKELNIGSLDDGQDENQSLDDKWEEELQRDLQEFELVSGGDVSALDEEALNDDLMELGRVTEKKGGNKGC